MREEQDGGVAVLGLGWVCSTEYVWGRGRVAVRRRLGAAADGDGHVGRGRITWEARWRRKGERSTGPSDAVQHLGSSRISHVQPGCVGPLLYSLPTLRAPTCISERYTLTA